MEAERAFFQEESKIDTEFLPEEPEPQEELEPQKEPELKEESEPKEEEKTQEKPEPRNAPESQEKSFRAEWSEQYNMARQYLYGGDTVEQDFDEAFRLFLSEAESGNALAMYDLGRMSADGLGCEMEMAVSHEWYRNALDAFHAAVLSAEKRQLPYLQYRIGKMYAAGLGTERAENPSGEGDEGNPVRDYELAAEWFSKAVSANHKYAQYSLAGLYYRGQGVNQDYEQALQLYRCSANQKNPYASYELAKMYRDGIGTEKNTDQANRQFQDAFDGFLALEAQSHDDKLQYRIGQMLHTGVGAEKDDEAAELYWERSAKLGNVNAQYALGKLWLENGTGEPEKAIAWLTKAAEGGNAAAQYTMGKLYRDGEHVERDLEKAIRLFTLSAEKNDYAAYALGKLYLPDEDLAGDIEKAVKYLSLSANQGNQFARYTLGKLYLTGEEVSKNIEKALKLLTKSANQGNQFAQYQLGKLYLAGEDIKKEVENAIRWLTAAADQGNQFAQYALGKLYLCGRDVPRDKEKAVPFLEASAAQGNIYARFLLDHLDSFHDPSVLLAATRLMHRLGNVFQEDYRRGSCGGLLHIDRKRLRRLREKKQAQGHAHDDHEQRIQY